jgi:lysozyme family protein
MTMFDKAFELVMINEGGNRPDGGYVADPYDKGGETKYGISQAAHPDLVIAELTMDEAKAIYEKDYWLQNKCDQMPWAIGWVLFDCVVNHNPMDSAKWLQAAVGVAADGVIGTKTLAAIAKHPEPFNVARDMTLARRDYVEGLHNYDRFKAGWNRRHLDTLIGAIQWAESSTLAE